MDVEQVKQVKECAPGEPGGSLGLKAERVQELLGVGWRVVDGETALQRVRVFPDARVAKEYANYVSALASSLRLPVQTRLAGKRCDVILRFTARPVPAHSVEEALLDLAAVLG